MTMAIPGYDPNFVTVSLRTILSGAGIDPDKVVKVKSGNKVRFVSPLGHGENSMAAAIDFCLLKGITNPKAIIETLDASPAIAEQRKKFLKTKQEINMPDLLAKIDSHFVYYCQRHFDGYFTRTFGTDPKVVRAIRKAARTYMETTWKPGLKEYRKAMNAVIVKVAEEVVQEENGTMALHQAVNLSSAWLVIPKAVQATLDTADTVPAPSTEVVPLVPAVEKRVCCATTKAGSPCKAFAVAGGEFCRVHAPKSN